MDRLNHWLTLGANIGVLIGILFLAYEVELSRTATIADIFQNRAHSRSDADLQIALSSPNFIAADMKFQALLKTHSTSDAVAQLSDEERYLVKHWHASLMIRFDNVAFQHSLGLIPEAYWNSIIRGIRNFMPIWQELGVELPDTSRETYKLAVSQLEASEAS